MIHPIKAINPLAPSTPIALFRLWAYIAKVAQRHDGGHLRNERLGLLRRQIVIKRHHRCYTDPEAPSR